MTADRDLRRAWIELRARRPGGDLEDEPEDLRRLVEAMRRAWRELPSPVPVMPAADRRRPARPVPSLVALVVAGLALALIFPRTESGGRRASTAPKPDLSRPRVLVANRDRVEMRAGSVHLVLLRPAPIERGLPTESEVIR